MKKGPWSPEEDAKLKEYIEQYGTGGNWIALPQKIGIYIYILHIILYTFKFMNYMSFNLPRESTFLFDLIYGF